MLGGRNSSSRWVTLAVAVGLLACKSSETTTAKVPPLKAVSVSADMPKASPTAGTTEERSSREIHFAVDVTPEERPDFPDGVDSAVSLESPEPQIARLRARDEIVIPKRKVIVIIDYPLSKPVQFPVEASGPTGFSRAELVRVISRLYHRVYDEEEKTAKRKTIPPGERTGLINRNATDGRYGICCHDLGDLVLHTVEVSEGSDGTIYLELGIDS